MTELNRYSLHARLALWMVVSTMVTLTVFSAVLFVSLRLEEASELHGVVSGAEPLAFEASEQMLVAMVIAGPIALLAATGGAIWLSHRALRPLTQIIHGARELTTSNLHERLPVPRSRDELHDLTMELNALLARLDQGFAALSRYASDASHELRTPLAVVASELEVGLRRPRSSHDWEDTASRALTQVSSLANLVDALLALARAEGPLERRAPFDLREQVDLVLGALVDRAGGKQIALVPATEGSEGPIEIEGDPDAVASAFRNLVDNAIRYTPAGGRIRVSMTTGASTVTTVVSDTGPGVPEAEREAIFQPLRRGTAGSRTEQPGLGLGLSIARRIVERHGGTVSVENSPEGGARFVVTLPLLSPHPTR